MNDWFEWNGVRCTDYGIYVTEQPPPTIPEERVTFTEVPGRSGSLTTLEGDYVYEDMVLTATCVISDPERIPEIAMVAFIMHGWSIRSHSRRSSAAILIEPSLSTSAANPSGMRRMCR